MRIYLLTHLNFLCLYVSLNTIYLAVSAGFTFALNVNVHTDVRKAEEDKCDTSMVHL